MVYQTKSSDCGMAAVRDVLVLAFRSSVYATVALSNTCDSFLGMENALAEEGLSYLPYAVHDLKAVTKENLPAIAQVKNGEASHFIVVRKIRKAKVWVDDPQFGSYALSQQEFAAIFLGKMLLRTHSVPKKDKRKNLRFFKKREKVTFFFLFVAEALFLSLLFYSFGKENGFFFSVFFGVASLLLLIFQNRFFAQIRKRFDHDILLPYMKESPDERNFAPLSHLLDDKIRVASEGISYAVGSVLLSGLLITQDILLSLLAAIGLLFPLLLLLLVPERNKTERDCTLQETLYLKNLKEKSETADSHFLHGRKRATVFQNSLLGFWFLETAFASAVILLLLWSKDSPSISAFIFYLGSVLSLSALEVRAGMLFFKRDAMNREINSLSQPLATFFLRYSPQIRYNRNTNKGESSHESSQAHSGLSRQDGAEKDSAEDV
jgi:predicted double-glycine peptidase